MSCYRPVIAFQRDDGSIVFAERGRIKRELRLPCGYCIGCRLDRSRVWAIRCMHEAQMHADNCFITLTYNDEHFYPSLIYRDFQLFMYKLRRVIAPVRVRFFMCGEYGSVNYRPHFHALLFGYNFKDRSKIKEGLWRSSRLELLWTNGFSSVGDATYESAGYVAKYSLKKVSGPRAVAHYRRVDPSTGEVVNCVPEFAHMSLKPGIGYTWFQKYWKDCYAARDGIVRPGGATVPTPRYYDRLMSELNAELMEEKDFARYLRAGKLLQECTPERLAAREMCAIAREQFYKARKL